MSGIVSIGDDPTKPVDAYVFATAIPLSEYETKISAVARGGAGPGASVDGPVLRIGVRSGQGFAPSISIFLDDLDVSDRVCQSLEPKSGSWVIASPCRIGGI